MHPTFAALFAESQWLIEPKALRALVKRAEIATPADIEAAVKAYGQRESGPQMVGDIAVINACGPISYKASWFSMYFGGATIEDMQRQFRMALADPAVKTIAFRWDSPGGVVDMVQEFGEELFAARGQKPIISVADTMIASAAYWLASQTDAIYASASAQVGSIGVYTEHDDISAMLEKVGVKITLIAHGDHKVDANPYEPLSDAARADLQARVDEIGAQFDGAVARGRGVTKAVVLEQFGQGKVFRGKEAISLGLADKPGTFQQVIGKLTKGRPVAGVRAGVMAGKKADAPADTMDPVDGECEEGYELGDDGLCHLVVPDDDDEEAAAPAATDTLSAADQDALAIAAALSK